LDYLDIFINIKNKREDHRCVCEIGVALLLFSFSSYAVESQYNDNRVSFDILK
jgi:hypothetical protein